MIEAFTKKAKDTYKKYEAYLDNTEDLLNHAILYFQKTADLAHRVMDNALLGNSFDIKEHFVFENKDELDTNIRNILGKFAKSGFLSKKKLFLEVGQKMNLRNNLKIEELQTKYDKFLDKELEEGLPSLRKMRTLPSNEQSSISYREPKSMSMNTDEQILKEEYFEQCYMQLIKDVRVFKGLLKDGFYNFFNKKNLVILTGQVKELIAGIFDYFNKYRDHFVEFEEKEFRVDTEINMNNFNEEVEGIANKLDEIEKIEYEKLMALKDKNNKLNIIQSHKKQLEKQNDELELTITSNEFDLLVSNEIILAYEKSINEKEDVIREKNREIDESMARNDILNKEVSTLTEELISKLMRCKE
jgi:hypothetical protein